jgi:hypothetical protein
MKKGMPIITIVVALSFLVSMIAVAPLFAAQATKTTPTTKQVPQQGPTQAPQTPQTPTVKSPATPTKTYEKAKSVFWDLEFDRLEVKGVVLKGIKEEKTIDLNPGETVTFKIYYKLKTPPVKEITEADVKRWGSGSLTYRNYVKINLYEMIVESNGKAGTDRFKYVDLYGVKSLPKFTWEDVMRWKILNKGKNGPSVFNIETSSIQWTPLETTCYANIQAIAVDEPPTINETDEWNNIWVGKLNVNFRNRPCPY